MAKPLVSVVSLVCLLFSASIARAQIYEAVGTRAQGMGGAFVAVANDASATWWNPAGLASGTSFSAVLEKGQLDDPGTAPAAGPARRDGATGIAIMMPSLALSYYRLRVEEVSPTSSPIAGAPPVRQDQEAAGVALRALSIDRFGLTIGQSFTRHLAIASTFALLHGGVGSGSEIPSTQAIDDAANLGVGSETHGDIDVGALVSAGALRVGASVKHLVRPRFGDAATGMELGRQARAGIALVTHAGTIPLTLAGDADLTKTPTVNGDAQHIAGGAEAWLDNRRFGVRGGVSANLVGGKRTAASSGLSVALKTGLYADGALTFGGDTTKSGWGLSLRATF